MNDTTKPQSHTPGPWGVTKQGDIYSETTGDILALIPNPNFKDVQEGEQEAIMEANVRLFAAAPELLTALRDAVYIIKDMGAGGSMLTRFEAAIAKAETGGAE